MISRTFGAPFGGTMRGAHQGVDSEALSLMTPPKGGLGGGSWAPSIDVVAVGEPRTPFTCWATAPEILYARATADAIAKICRLALIVHPLPLVERLGAIRSLGLRRAQQGARPIYES